MLFKVTFLTKENGFWNFNRILEFSESKFMTQICVCIYIYIHTGYAYFSESNHTYRKCSNLI